MKKLYIILTLLIGCVANGYGAVQGAYYQHFSVELDYVLMRRANSQNKHLAAAAGGPEGIPIESTPIECRKEEGKPYQRREQNA